MNHLTDNERATAFACIMLRLRDVANDAQQFAEGYHWQAARDALHVARELYQQADALAQEGRRGG
jgi:hypothetical protein